MTLPARYRYSNLGATPQIESNAAAALYLPALYKRNGPARSTRGRPFALLDSGRSDYSRRISAVASNVNVGPMLPPEIRFIMLETGVISW